MHQYALLYTVASVSVTLTFITTLLNIRFSTFLHDSMSGPRSASMAAVSLSAMSCVSLVILSLIFGEGNEACTEVRKTWKARARSFIGIYLFVSAVIHTSAMAWSGTQSLLIMPKSPSYPGAEAFFVAGCTIETVSVFGQGLICGLSILSLTKRENRDMNPLPSPFSWQASSETTLQERRSLFRQIASGFTGAIPSLRRCFRGVLPQRHSKDGLMGLRPSPLTTRGRISAPKSVQAVGIQEEGITDRKLSATRQGIHTSPLLPPLPWSSSPRMPSFEPLNTGHESTIHPLFRPASPLLPVMPPPTPSPGTNIAAAPSAGQTISPETLEMIRSRQTRSVSRRPSTSSLPIIPENSPEVELQSFSSGNTTLTMAAPLPAFVLSADIRNSFLRYEKNRSGTF